MNNLYTGGGKCPTTMMGTNEIRAMWAAGEKHRPGVIIGGRVQLEFSWFFAKLVDDTSDDVRRYHQWQLCFDATKPFNVIDDPSRQWWVADGRFSFAKPFYGLRIAPILPEDSGVYRCRLETDPLFALTMSTAHVELAVMEENKCFK
ncbi:hypothetical protein NECAME_07344 [Necator americanus]|uniref:Ig-like domain-containing protein n=1 Tax=Necator americanus TaxID=51031 RepID=W2TR35_NECAM|nr:hypothetical protein NECAME_07344 [Necator americanus]ETN83586.1 hypothetical protein NECAME_07344 [Necator americanus]